MQDIILNHAHGYWFALCAGLAFVWLVVRYGRGPVVRAIDARELRLHSDSDAAARARREATAVRALLADRLGAANRRVVEALRAAYERAAGDRSPPTPGASGYPEEVLREIETSLGEGSAGSPAEPSTGDER